MRQPILFSPCDQYVDDLKATWRSSVVPGSSEPAIIEKESSSFTWADLFELERAILSIEAEDMLRRHAWIIRDRYRSIAGDQRYQTYQASSPPDAASASTDLLRADLEILLNETQYLLLFQAPRERMRSVLTTTAYALIIAALLVTTAWNTSTLQGVGTTLIVFFLGWIGGNLSVIQRIQALPDGDPLFRMSLIRASWFALISSPITGGAFAVILYLVFIAKLLQGSFFPMIDTPTHPVGFWDFALTSVGGTGGIASNAPIRTAV